jgi:hypothetical protein
MLIIYSSAYSRVPSRLRTILRQNLLLDDVIYGIVYAQFKDMYSVTVGQFKLIEM